MNRTDLDRIAAEAETAQARYREAAESWRKSPEGQRERALDRAQSWDGLADAAKDPAKKAEFRAKADEQRKVARDLSVGVVIGKHDFCMPFPGAETIRCRNCGAGEGSPVGKQPCKPVEAFIRHRNNLDGGA